MSGIRFALAPVIGYMTIQGYFLPSLCSSFIFVSLTSSICLCQCSRLLRRVYCSSLRSAKSPGNTHRPHCRQDTDGVSRSVHGLCRFDPLASRWDYHRQGRVDGAGLHLHSVETWVPQFGVFQSWFVGPKEMMRMVRSLEVKPSLLGKVTAWERGEW